MKSSSLLLLKALFFLPVLAGVAVINYTQDPVNVFASFESRLAHALLSGSNVTDYKLSTEAERFVQKYYIKRMRDVPEVVVLGSSRTMCLHSDLFEGRRFVNNSISAAGLEDYIAFYAYYREKRKLPAVVVLNIDPWLFNKYNNLNDWKAISEGYYRLLAIQDRKIKFRFSEFIPDKLVELFSFSYFQKAVERLKSQGFRLKLQGKEEFFKVTPERYNEQNTILSDGSREMDRKSLSHGAPESIDNASVFLLKGEVNRYHKDFMRIDPEAREKFEQFVAIMKQDGVKVVFFLPPYHPYVYRAFIKNHFDICNVIEAYLQAYATTNNHEMRGSYNPFSLGLKEEDFYDALHFKEKTFRRIFQP